MGKTKELETVRETPIRWLADWFDMPDLFTRLESMRPSMFTDRIKVEEELHDDKLVIRAEVPGIDPDKDVELFVGDGMLRLHVERRKEMKEEKEGRFRSEFSYGSFTRSVALPKGASATDVKATYTDGILEITVPVAAPTTESTRVAITRS
jgi:HSP20 family protein